MVLHLAEARKVVDAALARAQELKIEISVAVCNRDGRLIALNTMDGAIATANDAAVGKAVAAAVWGRPSGDPKGPLAALPPSYVVGVEVSGLPVAGGLPILRDGVIEGACGVAGVSDYDQDEDCARAGIAALSLTSADRS